MPRFFLLDPALTGTAGHHHDFARNVLDAAASAGFTIILAGHRRANVSSCGQWPIRRAFRDGLWAHQSGGLALRAAHGVSSLARRLRPRSAWLEQSAEWLRDSIRSVRFAADAARLLATLECRAGDQIFIPNMTLVEVRGLTQLLRANPELLRATWHLEFHFPVYARGKAHRPEKSAAARCMQRALVELRDSLDRQAANRAVFLYADTDELTDQYESLHAGVFQTLPIPVDAVFCPSHEEELLRTARAVRVAYVGDARVEKGYPHLPGMLREVWHDLLETGQARFVFQSNCRAARGEKRSRAARDELASWRTPQVQLLSEPLSSAGYQRLVLDADVILLPYEQNEYDARSSGILAEALCAGKPVVVPEGTWMAAQLVPAIRRFQESGERLQTWGAEPDNTGDEAVRGIPGPLPRSQVGTIVPPGPAGLADGLREIVAHLEHYRRTAQAFSQDWSAFHNARSLVNLLMKNTAASQRLALHRTPRAA
jgi:glycosyltransferase involved in cell wall biosynthesis